LIPPEQVPSIRLGSVPAENGVHESPAIEVIALLQRVAWCRFGRSVRSESTSVYRRRSTSGAPLSIAASV